MKNEDNTTKTARERGEGMFANFGREELIAHIRLQANLIKSLREGNDQPTEKPDDDVKSEIDSLHTSVAQERAVLRFLTRHHQRPLQARERDYGHAYASVTHIANKITKGSIFSNVSSVVRCLNDMEASGYLKFVDTDQRKGAAIKGEKRVVALRKMTQILDKPFDE